ncbi:MAG TPA: RNA 2',3'-cyclic phosphodiesterase [Bryobacteraceae bacterium]|jgi:2'-5' RNA ligase
MRLFTAIEIPVEVKLRLTELLEDFRPAAKLSWSPADNLHVTTKFIGEWPDTRLDVVKEALMGVTGKAGFQVSVRGLGWFPNSRNPRVFWAGVEAGPELAALAKSTDEAMAAIGVPGEEREYQPHLTLARRRKPVPVEELRKRVDAVASTEFGSFAVSSFSLFLSAAGKYTRLQEYHL